MLRKGESTVSEQGVPRQEARSDVRNKLEEIQQRLDAVRREVDAYILGLVHDPGYEGRFVEQQVCDGAAQAISALDSGVNDCEQALKQLYRLVWIEL
jgi:hypothetical protein